MMHRIRPTLAVVAALAMYFSHAQAQLAPSVAGATRAALNGQQEERADGLFVAPLGGTGLNADRARGYGGGLRLSPQSGAYIGYQFGNWTIGSALLREHDTERATPWLDMGASYGFNLTPKQRISLDGGVSLRAPGHWDARNPSFMYDEHAEPGAGLRLSWRYNFGRNHYVSTILGFDHRFDSPWQDGPESERNTTTFGTVYGYRFW